MKHKTPHRQVEFEPFCPRIYHSETLTKLLIQVFVDVFFPIDSAKEMSIKCL